MSFEEAVGLGVTVALVDALSSSADPVISKFREMETTITGGATHVEAALGSMESGLAAVGAGAVLLGGLALIGGHAAEASAHIHGLEASVTALAGDSGQLVEQLNAIADASGKFKRTELAEAGKQLLGMGVAADQIPGILDAAAKRAAVLGQGVGETAQAFETMRLAMAAGAEPTRALKGLGLTLGDLAAQGIRVSKGKIVSSMDEVMEAAARALSQKFGARAAQIAGGLDALKVQIGETIEQGFEAAGGAGLEKAEKGILAGFLEVLRAGAPSIGKAFGEGLSAFYGLLAPVGAGLKAAALHLVEFLKEHPAVVRLATALAGIAGVALVVAGGVALLGGAVRLLPLALAAVSSAAEAGVGALGAMAGAALPFLALAALAGVVAVAWEKDFGGLRTTLTGWYNSARLVVQGVVALFTSSEGGIGEIPEALYDQLVAAGLWPIVAAVFDWGNRIVELVKAAWSIAGDVVSLGALVLGGAVTYVIGPLVGAAVAVVKWVAGLVDLIGANETAASVFKVLGYTLGIVGAAFAIYYATVALLPGALQVLTLKTFGAAAAQTYLAAQTWIVAAAKAAYAAATEIVVAVQQRGILGALIYGGAQAFLAVKTGIVTAATWLWNAALTANPIGLIIVGIAALIAGIALLVIYWDHVALAAAHAWKWMEQAIGADTSGVDKTIAELEQRIADAKVQADKGKASEKGKASGIEVLPPAGTPTAEEREAAFGGGPGAGGGLSALAGLLGARGGDRGGGERAAPRETVRHFHFELDGKPLHASVRERDGDLEDREFGE